MKTIILICFILSQNCNAGLLQPAHFNKWKYFEIGIMTQDPWDAKSTLKYYSGFYFLMNG